MILKQGDVLGFETDTVWGLGCLPDDKSAVDKIYEIKGRDRSKPLILMSNALENLMPYVLSVPDYAKVLMEKHFPGALTLIFEKSDLVPDFVTSGKNTVGIRVPNHKGFQKLCLEIEDSKDDENKAAAKAKNGAVLATTSLNFSNEPPVKDFFEANEKFGAKITVIDPKHLNGGQIQFSEETLPLQISSTVVLCTGETPVILRQGSVWI